jgi:hypothetical protein
VRRNIRTTRSIVLLPQKNDDGTYMVDKDGLPLYRSFLGTNLSEALSRKMISSIGHTKSGPRYSNNLFICVCAIHIIGERQSEIDLTSHSWATAWEI